jgi:hypothetical protein
MQKISDSQNFGNSVEIVAIKRGLIEGTVTSLIVGLREVLSSINGREKDDRILGKSQPF